MIDWFHSVSPHHQSEGGETAFININLFFSHLYSYPHSYSSLLTQSRLGSFVCSSADHPLRWRHGGLPCPYWHWGFVLQVALNFILKRNREQYSFFTKAHRTIRYYWLQNSKILLPSLNGIMCGWCTDAQTSNLCKNVTGISTLTLEIAKWLKGPVFSHGGTQENGEKVVACRCR